ncbi:hypothetical protein NOV72_05673 [Caballeronia novacaledonica]|uniref:DUF2380 domain-containing protein n=1 Tax=Caballeronia novacaledonica TaxID=1544861 RepID=A0A2U3IED2_9BURK|nr:DUF3280 domain-containing protein [Caballeronia novacaledonica]SPB18473.1 hypothetical protein NOV72_05673 [Caballeronia novacaledonica]
MIHTLRAMLVVTLAAVASGAPAQHAPQSIAMLDCTLIDDNAAYNDAEIDRIQAERLAMVSGALRDDLRARALFRVADNAQASDLIASLKSTQDMSACNGCERRVAKQLGTSRVGVCWVQKISNLILNMNLRVEDADSGALLFQRSVDIRGNTDLSWKRGAKALVDLLAGDPSATR